MNKFAFTIAAALMTLLAGCADSPPPSSDLFLQLSNKVVAELAKPPAPYSVSTTSTTTHHEPFFEDAYGTSALCEAYKVTQNVIYLNAAVDWSERMIAYQNQMTPSGAYYMNYNRQPGQNHGDWYVADAATIAAAILRTSDLVSPGERVQYLKSVEAFAALVSANYINPDGGVSDGIWGTYTRSWWASTANFGALAFMLYKETGNTQYLVQAQGAFDWLVKYGLANAVSPSLAEDGPSVVFYCGEFYARALPFVIGTPRKAAALQQLQFVLHWLAENQKSQNPDSSVDYLTHSHMAGMPHIMYATRSSFPSEYALANAEMTYLHSVLNQNQNITQAAPWALLTWFIWSETGMSPL